MLNQIQAIYRSIKAAKARSDALVEEGRQMTGWHRSVKNRQNAGSELPCFNPQLFWLTIDRCFYCIG